MQQNTSTNITENDKLALELIPKIITGSTFNLLGNTVRIIAANQARQLILEKEEGIQPSNTSLPDQLAAFSTFLSLLGNTILANAAFIRLKELEDSIKSGTSNSSTTPDVNIVTGYSLDVLGHLIRLLGNLQRLNE